MHFFAQIREIQAPPFIPCEHSAHTKKNEPIYSNSRKTENKRVHYRRGIKNRGSGIYLYMQCWPKKTDTRFHFGFFNSRLYTARLTDLSLVTVGCRRTLLYSRWAEKLPVDIEKWRGCFFASRIYLHTCEVTYKPLRPQGQFQVQFPGWPTAAALRAWSRAL